MTEGPTARLRAIQIWNKFGNHEIKSIYVRSKKLHVNIDNIIGKKLNKATSYGKNILLYLNGYIIRIHLMMYGSIKFEESKPFKQCRLAINFDNGWLYVYNAPIVEIGKSKEIENMLLNEYGIDALFNWDEKKLLKFMEKYSNRKIGDLLLDQHVFAGIGNILRNEILFRARINPERKMNELNMEEKKRIIKYTKDLSDKFLELKIKNKSIKDLLMVYNKKFCPLCGNKLILYYQEPNKRKTFYCQFCQK